MRTATLVGLLLLLAGCSAERAGADSVAKPAAAHSAERSAATGAQVAKAARTPAPDAPAQVALVPATAELAATAASSPGDAPPPVRPDRDWHEVRSPTPGSSRSIGGYSAGCITGAAPLPVRGPGYLVMRPGRRRHFGHPELVGFVRTLGAALVERKLGEIVIGDLGQPRGGPAPDGHSSHQSGLDADLWYPNAQTANGIPASERARRALKPLPVANFPAARLTEHWNARVPAVLRLASQDARVDRIFVNPMIKRALCQSETDRAWLRKLRPWWGHDAHFHVRLTCPAGSPACVPQAALAAGDGCELVDWWFSKEATAERDEERAKYRARVGPGDVLPAECIQLLAAADDPK